MILHLCDAFQKGIVRELSFSNEITQNEQVADDVASGRRTRLEDGKIDRKVERVTNFIIPLSVLLTTIF
jgi:pyruvate kinase